MFSPSFLQIPIYAFELSDRSYKYLHLKEKKGAVLVQDFGEGEIAAGVIEHGDIKRPDALVSLLKELFAKKGIKFVAITLPEEKGFIRNIKLTGVREDEIGGALALQLEEHIPLPPSEVIFDYFVDEKEKDHIDVVLNAFPRLLVESYLSAFHEAGALPVWAESELWALSRSVVSKTDKKTSMLIDWGKTRTSFAIVKNGMLRFASTVLVGGDVLNEAIAKTLNADIDRAEKLKKTYGFLRDPKSSESIAVFQAVVPVVAAISEEAEKYISFWQTHSEKKEGVQQIFISGGDANLRGLPQHLAREFKIPVYLASPWVNLAFPQFYLPAIEMKESLRFAPSVGLAIKALEEEKFL